MIGLVQFCGLAMTVYCCNRKLNFVFFCVCSSERGWKNRRLREFCSPESCQGRQNRQYHAGRMRQFTEDEFVNSAGLPPPAAALSQLLRQRSLAAPAFRTAEEATQNRSVILDSAAPFFAREKKIPVPRCSAASLSLWCPARLCAVVATVAVLFLDCRNVLSLFAGRICFCA